MSLKFLPEELILFIMEGINTNKDMIALVTTCKSFWKLGKKYGYIRSIKFGMQTDYMNFIHLYYRRNDFLHRLTMENMDKPMSWIPKAWPKEMIFNKCILDRKLIDPPLSPTETLVISHLHRHLDYNNVLKINWSKIPNLRVLDVYAPDMEFTGIEQCQKLETVRINLINPHTKVPAFLANLPKLRTIEVIFFYTVVLCIEKEN